MFTACGASAAEDLWDLAPIRYSDTVPKDAMSSLAADLASGKKKVEGETGLERLRFVLKTLDVSEDSQVLVFSKTSHQNSLIRPDNPRALYFSPNAYVGYVPGGKIEVITQDSVLGPVFYLIGAGSEGGLKIERDLSTCISCHGTTATENVPGLQVRSVFPDEDGDPLLGMGTSQVNHETPLAARWGGYYVTGRSSLPHLGNRTYQDGGSPKPLPSDLANLSARLEVSKYPRPTSDIVALMVLEHQCRMHNLLTTASMNYRRAYYLGHAMDAAADPDGGSAGRVADGAADQIVDCLFFKDEADPGENIEGGEAFQKSFTARFSKTSDGRSLADFQLFHRLFKHRCSFMVYSAAFRDLPPRVKWSVLEKMHRALEGENSKIDWLKAPERDKITAILSETLPGW
ncbi:MAG: hypothetical protein ABIS50_26095 [Luteolibacter sp.]|uniref:hypothetical protein n=1 Tax=Luteolibacter sp. TaxID=1962973 RepID=UPI0032645483